MLGAEELDMTSASESVTVIATQVARTDRRALSQAWYSALHLARAAAPERRRPVSDGARRIARALASLRAQPPAQAARTIDLAGGRVQLVVRTDGRTTRLVALCSPALREPVERALAGARYALAAS
jgi:hypothetical protein